MDFYFRNFIGYLMRTKHQFGQCIILFESNKKRNPTLPQAAWLFIPNSPCHLVRFWLRLAFSISTLLGTLLGNFRKPWGLSAHWGGGKPRDLQEPSSAEGEAVSLDILVSC